MVSWDHTADKRVSFTAMGLTDSMVGPHPGLPHDLIPHGYDLLYTDSSK